MNSIFFQKVSLVLGLDTKFVWNNASQQTCFATLNVKLVNITFTPQRHTYIYSLLVHESIVNNLPCTYFVTNGVFPSCTCLHFVSNAPSFKHSYFLSYKHMYYIYNVHVSFVLQIHIHQPSLNRNNVDVNLFVLLDCIFGNIVSNS
jgi:hypothetical protein